jgi:hypothetical protein
MLTQKITPQKIVAINIHDRLPTDATDLDVFVTVACHLLKADFSTLLAKK